MTSHTMYKVTVCEWYNIATGTRNASQHYTLQYCFGVARCAAVSYWYKNIFYSQPRHLQLADASETRCILPVAPGLARDVVLCKRQTAAGLLTVMSSAMVMAWDGDFTSFRCIRLHEHCSIRIWNRYTFNSSIVLLYASCPVAYIAVVVARND